MRYTIAHTVEEPSAGKKIEKDSRKWAIWKSLRRYKLLLKSIKKANLIGAHAHIVRNLLRNFSFAHYSKYSRQDDGFTPPTRCVFVRVFSLSFKICWMVFIGKHHESYVDTA